MLEYAKVVYWQVWREYWRGTIKISVVLCGVVWLGGEVDGVLRRERKRPCHHDSSFVLAKAGGIGVRGRLRVTS